MVYIFCGEDTYRSLAALKNFKSDWASKQKVFPESIIIDCREPDPQNAVGLYFEPQLFARPRVITIKYPDKESELWQNIISKELRSDPTTLVFVLCEMLPKQFAKFFQKSEIFYSPKLKGADFKLWANQEIKKRGLKINHDAAALIIEFFDGSTEGLVNELEKLSVLEAVQALGIREISALGAIRETVTIFPLFDAIGARKKKDAFEAVHQLVAQGELSYELCVSLIGYLRNMFLAHAAQSPKESAEIFFGKNPWWVSKLRTASNNFSASELRSLFRQSLWADYKLKTGQENSEAVLEELILKASRS